MLNKQTTAITEHLVNKCMALNNSGHKKNMKTNMKISVNRFICLKVNY